MNELIDEDGDNLCQEQSDKDFDESFINNSLEKIQLICFSITSNEAKKLNKKDLFEEYMKLRQEYISIFYDYKDLKNKYKSLKSKRRLNKKIS